MNQQRARKLLAIPKHKVLSVKIIKKAYHRACLMYHPDKNNSDIAHKTFIDIRRAYEVLMSNIRFNTNNDENVGIIESYWNMMKEYLNIDDAMIEHMRLLHKTREVALKHINKLDTKTITFIYQLVVKTKPITNIDDSIIDMLKDVIDSRNNVKPTESDKSSDKSEYNKEGCEKKEIIIDTDIDALLRKELMIFKSGNDTIYIPLWHRRINCVDINVEFIVVVRGLDDSIMIDENNDIHVYRNFPYKKLLKDDCLNIYVGEKMITLEKEQLVMQEYQTIECSNIGIPRISKDGDLYNADELGSIFVHITALV
jgi:hypothetical protein